MQGRCDICGKVTDKLTAIDSKFEWDNLFHRSRTIESVSYCEECNSRATKEMRIRGLLYEFCEDVYVRGDQACVFPADIEFLELAHKIYNIATE